MNNDEFFDNDLERDVRETLSQRAHHATEATTPTTRGWEALMEQTTTSHTSTKRRTQILAVAASFIAIAAIAGTIVAVSRNNETGKVTTVDKKKSDNVSTSTTPLNGDQLKKGAYIVKATGEAQSDSYLDIYNASTDKKLYRLPNVEPWGAPTILNFTGDNLLGSAGGDSNEWGPSFTLNLQSGERKETGGNFRIYSPDGTSYAEINGAQLWRANDVVVVSNKGQSKKILKVEHPNSADTLFVIDLKWINNSEFLFKTVHDNQIDSRDAQAQSEWRIGSISTIKSISSMSKVISPINTVVEDAMTYSGKSYVLTSESTSAKNTTKVSAYELNSPEPIWTKTFKRTFDIYFGETPYIIGGSKITDSTLDTFGYPDQHAFSYNQLSNKIYLYDGQVFLPKK